MSETKLLPIYDLALREIEGTYTSHDQRAAYRAGLSTAAAVCDQLATLYGKKNERTKAINNALVECGDHISKLRDEISVPNPAPDEARALREALEKIAHVVGETDPAIMWPWAQAEARAALSSTGDKSE